jgi:hypothetical protein
LTRLSLGYTVTPFDGLDYQQTEMEAEHPSFIKNIRAKFGHHSRSISQPPIERSIEWGNIPVAYRPVGQVETRVVKPDWPTVRADLPARYHPNPSRQEIKRSSTPSAPLLQLPRPRAMWRRSLEELSPTKKSEWWTDPDLEAQRMTFNIACALPPQYLEHPPSSLEDEEKSATRHEWSPFRNLSTEQRISFYDSRGVTPTPRTANSNEGRSPRRGSNPVHSAYSYHPRSRDDVTIDSLLTHPLLRVYGPDQVQESSR